MTSSFKYSYQSIKMTEGIETMRDLRLGRICIAKGRIKLTPGKGKALRSAPYRAGSDRPDFEKSEFENCLK